MLTTRERPPAAKAPVWSSRSAWLTLLAALGLYPVAIAVGLGNQDNEPLSKLISAALALLPPVGGILLGGRSALTGNRLGGLACATSSAWLTLIVMFFVGANYLWSGESLIAPNVFALVVAVIVGGAVLAAWHRFWKTPHRLA